MAIITTTASPRANSEIASIYGAIRWTLPLEWEWIPSGWQWGWIADGVTRMSLKWPALFSQSRNEPLHAPITANASLASTANELRIELSLAWRRRFMIQECGAGKRDCDVRFTKRKCHRLPLDVFLQRSSFQALWTITIFRSTKRIVAQTKYNKRHSSGFFSVRHLSNICLVGTTRLTVARIWILIVE